MMWPRAPDRDPRSPEDEEEEQQGLSDDDILRESGSEQDLDAAGGRASDSGRMRRAGLRTEPGGRGESLRRDLLGLEAQELSRALPAPASRGGPHSDLRDEAGPRRSPGDLDEHELDYDEEPG